MKGAWLTFSPSAIFSITNSSLDECLRDQLPTSTLLPEVCKIDSVAIPSFDMKAFLSFSMNSDLLSAEEWDSEHGKGFSL